MNSSHGLLTGFEPMISTHSKNKTGFGLFSEETYLNIFHSDDSTSSSQLLLVRSLTFKLDFSVGASSVKKDL